ncbi:GNAT family N-acetyltransferase [Methyloceanibacter sp.]|uniref:GNAT family N-acetyltransferase n=1 Tax=Methyloceanibacter sp. TaxID=1965321 RepID=UPI002D1D76E4|nr:GNAT family N-acetyltransferase [Methyloceanibacter sp.]HML92183.1 GNAT family N-acetyltransferase [Methyloceanibacter sp.]
MTNRPKFRPATLADAAALSVLVDIAGEGAPNRLWLDMAGPGHSALEVGRARARREEGGFSYRHATLAEVGDEIAACLIGYRLDDPYDLSGFEELPDTFQPLVRLEARAPGTWYVNVLATFPEFRGQGIGMKLLDVANERAREADASAASIIVGSWNEGAEKLYRRAGYRPAASEPAILPPEFPQSGDWLLMLRPLS